MRVSGPHGETEAFPALGRVTVLGGGVLPRGDFYRTYKPEPDRRDGERRQTRDRRRSEAWGRRHKHSRRRLDFLTARERAALVEGIETVWVAEGA